jgi:predicted transcriptional regulator
MECSRQLRQVRQRAGLTQRDLAARTGVAQPTIARIERGLVDPRLGTLERLLDACDARLAVERIAGRGVDRTQMRELLKLTPKAPVEALQRDAAGLAALDRSLG